MMENIHQGEFRLRDLKTRSVTLFPTRAHVVRELKDVLLKKGPNQITIVGLTPTVDEGSVKVEGTGSAIITDISTKLLPNREIFEEIYADDESSDDEGDDILEGAEEAQQTPELEALAEKLKSVCEKWDQAVDDETRLQDFIRGAEVRRQCLDSWGKVLYSNRDVSISDGLQKYKEERRNIMQDTIDATVRLRGVRSLLTQLGQEETHLNRLKSFELKKRDKAKNKVRKAKEKERKQKQLRQQEKLREKERLRTERESFWPRKCYSVVISLEVGDVDGTFARIREAGEINSSWRVHCDLTLSYITSSAHWSPCYDLALSTSSISGILSFDAQLANTTSETWDNCNIVLSTSQTTLSGVHDEVSELVPWSIKLAPRGKTWEDIVESREERQAHEREKNDAANPKEISRANMFGVGPLPTHAPFQRLIRKHETNPGCYMTSSKEEEHDEESEEAGEDSEIKKIQQRIHLNKSSFANLGSELTEQSAEPELAFQTPTFGEVGLTETYNIPGRKTLCPANSLTKQRIARIELPSVTFSHTVVAKYKPVAFLQASVQNPSGLTLLRGPVGLSLDGSFVGRSTLARCDAGATFIIGLGVDPAIRVEYARPQVRRSTAGLLARDNIAGYTRTATIFNTRVAGGKPVKLDVRDQIPVSQDERLRVEVRTPSGLVAGGNKVQTDLEVVENEDPGNENGAPGWGRAEASLGKGGEVTWDVVLNVGKGVKLTLEYEVSRPSGEHIEQDSGK